MPRPIILVFILLLPLVAADTLAASKDAPQSEVECEPEANWEEHAPIKVDSSALLLLPDAAASNGIRSGTGTADDPYVISKWHITTPDDGPALQIGRVDEHIVIEDLVLTREEWVVPRDFDPVALVYYAPNVTIRSITLTGASSVAMMLYGFFSNPIEELSFALGQKDPLGSGPIGLYISDFSGTIHGIDFCGPGWIIAGSSKVNRDVVVTDVRANADSQMTMIPAEVVSLRHIHGPIRVSISSMNQTQVEVRDSSLHRLSYHGGDDESASVLVDNVTFDQDRQDSIPAALTLRSTGTVKISNITVTRPVESALVAVGADVTVVDSVFLTSNLTYRWELPIHLGCGAKFSRNDVYRGAGDVIGVVLEHERPCDKPVTGASNYFNGHEPVEGDTSHFRNVDPPKLGVLGSFEFTHARDTPNKPGEAPPAEEIAPTPATAALPLAIVLAFFGQVMRRRPGRHQSIVGRRSS